MADPKLCSILDCGKPHLSRGWCATHYHRWKAHGDPLKTLIPPRGEPARYLREVVFAYEGDECLTWPYSKTANGYGKMPNSEIVSRLVCEHVNGPPPTPEHQAAHSCGRGHLACVTKSHMSWKTRLENAADTIIHGTSVRGERHRSARLTEQDVRAIRALKGTMTQREIATQFGIGHVAVGNIHRHKTWYWLD